MTLAEIVDCAPFRLRQPRPLTTYEWTVVRGAIEAGFMAARRPVQNPLEQQKVLALLTAIQTQQPCPRWRQSSFGPPPAVAPYAYECLGAWFGALDPASQARALADVQTGLLCRPNPPWAACPHAQVYIGRGQRDLWEGAPQVGALFSGAERCAWPRQRTAYVPMTGQEMLEVFKRVGGTLPPQLEQAARFGAAFIQRDFLVGIQLKAASPQLSTQIAQASTPLEAARLAIEDMALIWAPGRGASVLFLLDEQFDPAKLTALLGSMMPELIGDIGLPAILPQMLPWLLPSQQQIMPFAGLGGLSGYSGLGLEPGTPPTTGVDVVDQPGDELPTDPPPIEGIDVRSPRPVALMLGAAAAALATAFVIGISRN